MKSLGMPNLPLVILPHPIGGLKAEELREKADSAIKDVVARLVK